MYECINCVWKGEELSKKPRVGKCPVCGDEVLRKEEGTASEKSQPSKDKSSIFSKVRDVVEDLADDGQLNDSNKRKKSKRGKR